MNKVQKIKPFKLTQNTLGKDHRNWTTIIDFTKIRKGGVPLEELF